MLQDFTCMQVTSHELLDQVHIYTSKHKGHLIHVFVRYTIYTLQYNTLLTRVK